MFPLSPVHRVFALPQFLQSSVQCSRDVNRDRSLRSAPSLSNNSDDNVDHAGIPDDDASWCSMLLSSFSGRGTYSAQDTHPVACRVLSAERDNDKKRLQR